MVYLKNLYKNIINKRIRHDSEGAVMSETLKPVNWRPLKINEEYSKLIPKHNAEDYASLEASIIGHHGAFESIKINCRDEILDGHTRYDICTKYGLGFTTEAVDLPTELDEKIYVIEANLQRRQLNDFQRVELYLVLEPLLAEKAKEQQGRRNDLTFVSNETNVEFKPINTLGVIAKKSGISRATAARVKCILAKGSEELKQRARAGKTSIAHAYNVVTTQEAHTNPQPLPEGTFNVIMADPAWQYDIQKRGSTLGHYESIPTEEICALKVPAADNAVLFLWATNPKLQEALAVMAAWGFRYRTNMVWVKDKIGNGYYFRGQHELLLVGEKGDMPVPEEQNRPPSVLQAPRRDHSEKPGEVYGIIEKMYPNRKYLELFAREKHEGWMSWGNEL